MNALFLLAFVWTLAGVCAGLGVHLEARTLRPVHLRHAAFLIALAYAGVLTRGQSWAWVGWLPMIAAVVLTHRSVRLASDKARTNRMFGRTVS